MSQNSDDVDHDFLCNSATQLLESGAEFDSCSDHDFLRRYSCNSAFAFAGSVEVLEFGVVVHVEYPYWWKFPLYRASLISRVFTAS